MKSVIYTEDCGLKTIREMEEGELDELKYSTHNDRFMARQEGLTEGDVYIDRSITQKARALEIYEAIILEERLRSIEERLNKIGQQR